MVWSVRQAMMFFTFGTSIFGEIDIFYVIKGFQFPFNWQPKQAFNFRVRAIAEKLLLNAL